MSNTSTKKALYPYTLQPIALEMSDVEFKAAQLALFEKSAQSVGIKSVKKTEWLVLAIMVVIACAGLLLLKNYSTIIFWLMLVLVVLYLLVRTAGLKWYMRREFDKQMTGVSMPEELKKLKLGVQSHGLVMSIPVNAQTAQMNLKGMTMRQAPMQQGIIPWTAVSQWDETDRFVFIVFEYGGQKGSQIIPKRLDTKGLPIATVINHLQNITPKGLKENGLLG